MADFTDKLKDIGARDAENFHKIYGSDIPDEFKKMLTEGKAFSYSDFVKFVTQEKKYKKISKSGEKYYYNDTKYIPYGATSIEDSSQMIEVDSNGNVKSIPEAEPPAGGGGSVGGFNFSASDLNGEVNIVNKHLSVHITKRPNRKIEYICIHYTAGGSSSKGSAASCYNIFSKRDASADFAVDDGEVVMFNPDLNNYYCWAVGDGDGKSTHSKTIHNYNSVSIEICSSLKSGYSGKYPNHDGWYFTDAALKNAIKLTKFLMKKLNIPKSNVVRHYDASQKACPGIIGWNTGPILDQRTGQSTGKKNNDGQWQKFKNML